MTDIETLWKEGAARDLASLAPLLAKRGYELDAKQPHLAGERFLMRAVTTESGRKLVLLGRRVSDGARVVIKAASDEAGMRELAHERACRRLLQKMRFAYELFASPEELLYARVGRFLLSIQAFIEQERTFLERPIEEQFSYALSAFKAQEGAHAATYEQHRVAKTFGSREAKDYAEAFGGFERSIAAGYTRLAPLMREAGEYLRAHEEVLDQYGGFLTHTDFVPHNFRIKDNQIWLLDYSSLRFGNKYEGWARFVNFMALYNPSLAAALERYVRDNRTPEESLSLKLMRVYRLGEITRYYVRAASQSTGDLKKLNELRVSFWSSMLDATLRDQTLSESVVREYQRSRDGLRSPEEKVRQEGLH